MSIETIVDMDENTLNLAIGMIYKHTGIRMNSAKKTLIQSRLRPRMRTQGILEYKKYLESVEFNKDELQEFINAVTTNETYFFRTQRVWDYFQNDFLINYFKQNPSKTLRIWSAAASTGEEAHTIGICCEEFKNKNPTFSYQIIGTDISTEVLAVGTAGLYEGRSIDKFSKEQPAIYKKYVEAKGTQFKVIDLVRNKIKFQQHNLFVAPPKDFLFDIVFLRNVLIYFDAPDQEKVIYQINKAMQAGGKLIIGESESINGLKTNLKYVAPLIYEK